jgi:sarcosine oxidase subunit delta
MLLIHCPYCEETREEEEFCTAGQAHIVRPLKPEDISDEQWARYLFFRKNPRGLHHELWLHASGCRKYFNMTRNTVTYQIMETYKMGQKPNITANEEGQS